MVIPYVGEDLFLCILHAMHRSFPLIIQFIAMHLRTPALGCADASAFFPKHGTWRRGVPLAKTEWGFNECFKALDSSPEQLLPKHFRHFQIIGTPMGGPHSGPAENLGLSERTYVDRTIADFSFVCISTMFLRQPRSSFSNILRAARR